MWTHIQFLFRSGDTDSGLNFSFPAGVDICSYLHAYTLLVQHKSTINLMERVGQLLEKLGDLYRAGADKQQLLQVLRMLESELTGVPMMNASFLNAGSGKVSVILPNSTVVPIEYNSIPEVKVQEKIIEVLQVDEKELEAELEELKKAADLKNEMSLKVRQARVEWDDPMEDIPTLASHRDYIPRPEKPTTKPVEHIERPVDRQKETGKEVNEVIGRTDTSLNERLKNAQAELSEKLQAGPVKDLRKAIGINDRYLYINELFNGNEAMFDRSLKTLNDFSVYPEAELWMRRELRTKMGWSEENALVKHFTQLVKRRFS